MSLFLAILLPVTIGGSLVGGIIVLAFVWKKIRPMIIIKTESGNKIFIGISHSKKRKNMHSLTQEGINGIAVDENTCYGLANAPSKIIEEIGTVSIEKAQELVDNIETKKINKIDKRKK